MVLAREELHEIFRNAAKEAEKAVGWRADPFPEACHRTSSVIAQRIGLPKKARRELAEVISHDVGLWALQQQLAEGWEIEGRALRRAYEKSHAIIKSIAAEYRKTAPERARDIERERLNLKSVLEEMKKKLPSDLPVSMSLFERSILFHNLEKLRENNALYAALISREKYWEFAHHFSNAFNHLHRMHAEWRAGFTVEELTEIASKAHLKGVGDPVDIKRIEVEGIARNLALKMGLPPEKSERLASLASNQILAARVMDFGSKNRREETELIGELRKAIEELSKCGVQTILDSEFRKRLERVEESVGARVSPQDLARLCESVSELNFRLQSMLLGDREGEYLIKYLNTLELLERVKSEGQK